MGHLVQEDDSTNTAEALTSFATRYALYNRIGKENSQKELDLHKFRLKCQRVVTQCHRSFRIRKLYVCEI